jgi:hypothetical protein
MPIHMSLRFLNIVLIPKNIFAKSHDVIGGWNYVKVQGVSLSVSTGTPNFSNAARRREEGCIYTKEIKAGN